MPCRHVDEFGSAVSNSATPAVKEALRYREALWAGYEALKERPVTVNTARKICTALRGHEVDVRSQRYIPSPTATVAINQIADLQAKVASKVRELIPRGDATALTELLFRQPYVRIEEVVQQGLAQRQTASRWLGILSDNHVLRKEKYGKHAVFINDSLLDLLFEYPLAT